MMVIIRIPRDDAFVSEMMGILSTGFCQYFKKTVLHKLTDLSVVEIKCPHTTRNMTRAPLTGHHLFRCWWNSISTERSQLLLPNTGHTYVYRQEMVWLCSLDIQWWSSSAYPEMMHSSQKWWEYFQQVSVNILRRQCFTNYCTDTFA